MNEIEAKAKIAKMQKIFTFFKISPIFAVIVPWILIEIDPFCADVKGDHMGCGLGGLFISFGIALILLLSSIIGMVTCSAIIKAYKKYLAQITLSVTPNPNQAVEVNNPPKISVVLLLALLVFSFAVVTVILLIVTNALGVTGNKLFVLPISGVLGVCISVPIAYLLRI